MKLRNADTIYIPPKSKFFPT